MQEVRVNFNFDAPQEKVFAGISDHAAFLSTSKIRCHLTRSGAPDKNGNGALREVKKGMLRFEEEISAFVAPDAFEYRILGLRGPFNFKLPFHHELGRLEFDTVGQQTRVLWVSRFRFSLPLFGPFIERKLAGSIRDTFLFFLKRLNGQLVDASGSA